MDEFSTSNGNAAKMRIDSLVSAQSTSPTALKSTPWLASADSRQCREIRPLHILLLEAKRAALEDEALERQKREQPLLERAATATIQPQLRPAPVYHHLSTPTISLLASHPPSSSSTTTTGLKERIFSRGLQGSTSSGENLSSFTLLNRTNGKQAVDGALESAGTADLRSLPSSSSQPPATVTTLLRSTAAPAMKENTSGATSTASQPKLLKLSIGGGLQQRRPLSGVQNLPPNGHLSVLTRTQSFPPPTVSPSRTSTLNLRKRSLEEARASPTTSASARILAQSLPNVKIHVQKKIKLMPRPAGQVQARPEGVKNVLVYHF